MKLIILNILILVLISCGKEEFASVKQSTTSTAPITLNSIDEVCANHTLVKPYVDFLFLWDNSSSQTFVNSQTKNSLANTVNLISQRFDYRILIAPMLASNNEHAFILSATDSGLSNNAKSMRIEIGDAYPKLLSFPSSTRSHENGIERTTQILEYNHNLNNGIFRKESYLVVVLMSNGNDQINTSSGLYNPSATNKYIESNLEKIKYLSGPEQLNTQHTRFISLVAHQACNSGWRIGESYQKFSKIVHDQFFDCSQNDQLDLQCGSITPDSHNICGLSFTELFDAVNDSVIETVIKHKYNYWPISYQKEPINFDIDTLKVTKSNGEEFFELPSGDDYQTTSGWRYLGWKNAHPTTYEPFVGEKKDAHLIELVGDAKVSYPECLVLEYKSPTYHYGYLSIPHKPLESSIIVKDGDNIVPDSKWEYIGQVEEQNMRVQGPANPEFPTQEFFPAEIERRKYIIKLDKSLIYKNDQQARFTVIYDTSSD